MFFTNFGGLLDTKSTNIVIIARMLTKKIQKNILTVLAAVLCVCMNAEAQGTWTTQHNPARNTVWAGKLEREIGLLTDSICTGRATGTRGNIEAGAWIARKFQKAGLKQFGISWGKALVTENGTIGHNILGLFPGSYKEHPKKYVIIGAHFDHLGTIDGRMFPGADANASGVVAMTSIAEMLLINRILGQSFPVNFIFAGFDANEMNMAGSNALWTMIEEGSLIDPVTEQAIDKKDIVFMVNIDQIGSSLSPLNDGREDYVIMMDGTVKDTEYKEILDHCNKTYDIGLDLGFTYYGSENFTKLFYNLSDQKVFSDNGIPSVMFTSGITMNNNKTWDDTASLNMEVLRKRIYLIYHWLLLAI